MDFGCKILLSKWINCQSQSCQERAFPSQFGASILFLSIFPQMLFHAHLLDLISLLFPSSTRLLHCLHTIWILVGRIHAAQRTCSKRIQRPLPLLVVTSAEVHTELSIVLSPELLRHLQSLNSKNSSYCQGHCIQTLFCDIWPFPGTRSKVAFSTNAFDTCIFSRDCSRDKGLKLHNTKDLHNLSPFTSLSCVFKKKPSKHVANMFKQQKGQGTQDLLPEFGGAAPVLQFLPWNALQID